MAALIIGIVGSPAALVSMTAAVLLDLLIIAVSLLISSVIISVALHGIWGAIGGVEAQACFIGGLFFGLSTTIGLSGIPQATIMGLIFSILSQTDHVGKNAQSCGVI